MITPNPWWDGFDYSFFYNSETSAKAKRIEMIDKVLKGFLKAVIFGAIGVFVLFIIISWIKTGSFTESYSGFFRLLFDFFPLLFVFVFIGVFIKGFLNKYKNQFAKSFAIHNNLIADEKVRLPFYPLPLFSRGNKDGIANIAIYTSRNMESPVTFANWSYTSGSGKNKQTIQKGLLVIDLPQMVPNMVLKPKSIIDSAGSDSYSNNEKRGLPAGVDNIFVGYSARGTETDFYYIFAPDVLEAAITYAPKMEIQLLDNKLYIISNEFFDLHDIATWKQLENMVRKMGGQVLEQVKRWTTNDAPVLVGIRNGRDIYSISSSTAGGTTLTSKTNVSSVIVFIVVVGIVIYNLFLR